MRARGSLSSHSRIGLQPKIISSSLSTTCPTLLFLCPRCCRDREPPPERRRPLSLEFFLVGIFDLCRFRARALSPNSISFQFGREINHQIKKNSYYLNLIKNTNKALEDKILRFSYQSTDNLDLIDEVIRENLGYSSLSEKVFIFKNPSNY